LARFTQNGYGGKNLTLLSTPAGRTLFALSKCAFDLLVLDTYSFS
jgi:hypothetical protein